MEAFLNAVAEFGIPTFLVAFIAFLAYQIYKDIKTNKRQKAADALTLEKERMRIEREDSIQKREDEREERRDKRESERIKHEDKRYDGLCGSINELSKKLTPVNHTPAEQDDDIRESCMIQTELDELTANGAARSYYFRFHNGGYDVLGKGMLKMSIYLESCPHDTPRMRQWQQVPRSMMPMLYQKLSNDGEYYIENVEDILQTDVKTYSFLAEFKSTGALFKAVKMSDGLIVGFVGMEINEPWKDISRAKIDISKKADRIAGILIGSGFDGKEA